jgi:CRP/FNR family transcriptional regulator
MKASVAAIEPNGQGCTGCRVRQFSVCASLGAAEMQEFEHLSRHIHFAPCETVFAEEEMTRSFYNLRRPAANRWICLARRFLGDERIRA